MEFLRVRAGYERSAWRLRPLTLVHEVLARREGAAAALWRDQIQHFTEEAAQQHLDDLLIGMIGGDGQHERSHTAHISYVDVGSGVQKKSHGLRAAGRDRHQQRRQATDGEGPVLDSRLGDRSRLGVDVSPTGEQQLHKGGVAVAGGVYQGCKAATILRLGVGALVEQQLDG